jgi:hypothetical protein
VTTAELILLVQGRILDTIVPKQFEATDILRALNDAQNEFAKQTLCIFAGDTKVDVAGGSPWFVLPTGVLWIRCGRLPNGTLIRAVTEHELDYGYFELNGIEALGRFSQWRNATGIPKFICTDSGGNSVRLVPSPEQGTSLTLEHYRMPVAMLNGGQGPEIPESYQDDLVYGAATYLYGVPDVEIFNTAQRSQDMQEWRDRLVNAQNLLQTTLRRQQRLMPLPPGIVYGQPTSLPVAATNKE